MILIDTSAIIAVLCKEDQYHTQAAKIWIDLLDKNERILCNNYILLETTALIQRRHGLDIIRAFYNDMVPILQVEWLDHDQHTQSVEALLRYDRRRLSLVDLTAFATMRRLGIRKAFTFDKHFAEQGFDVIPEGREVVN
ncbi:MAG: PIN domain-containing protein [Chloroflexota bacterium]|nr:PIN domain-containing protein [Chloroflexota bacterium]